MATKAPKRLEKVTITKVSGQPEAPYVFVRGFVEKLLMESNILRTDLLRGEPDRDLKMKRLRKVLIEQYDMRRSEEFGDLLGDIDED